MPEPDIIRLDLGQSSGLDELTGAPALFINMLVEGAADLGPRAVRTRPGIRAWATGPTSWPSTSPVVAMTILGGRLVYVTDDGAGTRRVFAVDGSTVLDLSIAATDPNIMGLSPVVLQTWREFAFACGGGRVQKISRGLVSSPLGGNPPDALDLTVIAQRLILVSTDEQGLFFWTNVGEAAQEDWDVDLFFAEAEARPDRLVGCDNTARELFMFGAGSTQVMAPDPVDVWANLGTLEFGCLAGTSVLRHGQNMMWLDDNVQIVRSGGRDLEVLSARGGIARTLKALQAPEDVWSFRANVGNHDLATWVWPTDGRALSLDLASQTWSDWRRWTAGAWAPWAPRSHLHWPERRLHLVGMPDGTICELTQEAFDDMGDPLRWVVRPGFADSPGRRHVVEARFPTRRGEASPSAKVAVSWRDDLGAFCAPIEATLGGAGDVDPDIVVSPAGAPHRRRQWQLEGDGQAAYLLAPGKATFEEAEF